MLIDNGNTRKSMTNTEIYLSDDKCSQVIFVEGTSTISRKEVVTNKAASHNTLLPTRNLPNILRNSNIRMHKNCETVTSDKMDTYFLLTTEHANTSFDLNTTSSSIDSEKEINYGKVATSKLHHQRKQVHNPLNLQYDAPDWNNNKNKRLLRQVDRVNALTDRGENATTTKVEDRSKAKRHLSDKKPKKLKARKAENETLSNGKRNKKSDFDFGLIAIPEIDISDKVVVLQNFDQFFSNDTLVQSICGSNASSYTSRSNANKSDVGLEETSFKIGNNEACDVKGTPRNISYNPVVSGGLNAEFNGTQKKISENKLANNKLSLMDNLEESTDEDIASICLFKPKVLYTCTCVNCTSYDKDIIFYEEPISTSTTGDDNEAELYSHLCDLYSDYYHIFGDIELKNSSTENLYWEEVEETKFAREDAYVDRNSVAKVIDNANALEDAQLCHFDKIQDITFETCPTEFIAHSDESKKSSKFTGNAIDCPDLENAFTEKGKIAFQNKEAFTENVISVDIPVSQSEQQQQQKKQDLYVIQCAQCGKLFHEKYHFRKHLTRCKFYKEEFKCHICEKIYRYKSSLVQHLKKVHDVLDVPYESFYTCDKCSKSYIRYRAFQRHVLLHDD